MGKFKVRLDHDGMAELLKSSGVADVVGNVADSVADNVRGHSAVTRNSLPVDVRHGQSDRARSIVAITHPAGLAVQAKHGVLTRAVSAAGLNSSRAGKGWNRANG